ncbi:MAG: hypothetical protein P9L92_08425 [Candidatus Electryonea clarkiae]|nr:hypothetical protein [Candidatus Electryonea clarkiae]MDP8288249.1 hypothetical protein [Candidatus Electryonea clarkiae]
MKKDFWKYLGMAVLLTSFVAALSAWTLEAELAVDEDDKVGWYYTLNTPEQGTSWIDATVMWGDDATFHASTLILIDNVPFDEHIIESFIGSLVKYDDATDIPWEIGTTNHNHIRHHCDGNVQQIFGEAIFVFETPI